MVWKSLASWHQLSLLAVGMMVCLLGVHLVMWRSMDRSIEMLQQEVARLDLESRGLIQKIASLKSIERDINTLRENLSSRVRQFPENIESNTFRRDVVEIAKRRKVTVRLWKPEIPLSDLQHSQTSIPITVKLEGNFQGTLQFLDDLRRLGWVRSIASLVISRGQESEDSSFIITNVVIQGLTPLGIEHVQKLLKA
jgi:Tfp pilus assembly protein PilO